MVAKIKRKRKGQAAIEMALSLPLIIWLIYYTINAVYAFHTAHIAQKYAAMGLWAGVNNRSKFVVDDSVASNRLHNREWMAVRYTDTQGVAPRRRIIFGPVTISDAIGLCREPGCTK